MMKGYRVFSWFVVVFLAAMIFYLSSISFEVIESQKEATSLKSFVYHIVIFFFFASFLLIALINNNSRKLLILGIFIAFLYAVSDEIHQIFTPGRDANILDIFLNSFGILLAGVVYLISAKLKNLFKSYF